MNNLDEENIMVINTASVKVMRSFDYCHFEVCLSSDTANSPEAVDELRKTAARLADKAVAQYKIAKEQYSSIESDKYSLARLQHDRDEALKKPESERSARDKAAIKKWNDREHWQRRARAIELRWECFMTKDKNTVWKFSRQSTSDTSARTP